MKTFFVLRHGVTKWKKKLLNKIGHRVEIDPSSLNHLSHNALPFFWCGPFITPDLTLKTTSFLQVGTADFEMFQNRFLGGIFVTSFNSIDNAF
ncbi:hypothetical protein DSCW_06540 [Desulfosarcina widdelii]|uniref:Uncharacterized protein n=1 Tax=Desulfosarcina widdelii TaxID=947919 RepID=A0A5K7Z9S7_9BACT|nr:hypothetical protein DSCW_06540 [Desulfosarcina widdelii]